MSAAIDLATIWAFIIAFTVFVYVVMDGFDLGKKRQVGRAFRNFWRVLEVNAISRPTDRPHLAAFYPAFLIGRAKSMHTFAFLRLFALEASLSPCTNNAHNSRQPRP